MPAERIVVLAGYIQGTPACGSCGINRVLAFLNELDLNELTLSP